jgi:hypothetical protein
MRFAESAADSGQHGCDGHNGFTNERKEQIKNK